MAQIFTCILLLLSVSGTFSKYVYIQEEKTRDEALTYCRQNYTDLAPVSNELDMGKLQELGNVSDAIWIGLERSSTDKNKWMWSGGVEVSMFFWAPGQPQKGTSENYGFIRNNTWHGTVGGCQITFFCYRAVVVRERKTWEEALEYCREHYDDLASVASETEMLLIQRELSKNITTENVWIGLRFLSGDWLWVDGQEMDYKAWGQGGKPSCPNTKMKCAALQVTGGSQSHPNHFLNSSATAGTGVNDAINVITGRGLTVASENGVWGARDCDQRLSFICY